VSLEAILTLAAIVLGPLAAVSITLWIEAFRKKKDAKLIVLRMLLSTRHLPSDPNYSIAIQLIPVEFNDDDKVLKAHTELLEAANVSLDGVKDERITKNTSIKLVRLIYQIGRSIGLKMRETDIETGNFGTQGFYYRDALLKDSQKAMRDVADTLWLQTRMLGGES
jgi:hypothetical protein